MRIVLATRVYPTHRPGGMPHVVQDRAEALAALGHEVHVLTTSHAKYGVLEGDVTVHHLNAKSLEYSEAFARECTETCKRLCPEIIHHDSLDVNRLWWADKPGGARRTAVTLHGFGPGAFLTEWNLFRCGRGPAPKFDAAGMLKEANALKQADRVIGVSECETGYLREWYGLCDSVCVYNPIPGYFFENTTDPPQDGPFLCSAISGHRTRGFDIAEEACKQAGVRLKTVSRVPRREMPKVYDECRAVIIPTFYAQGFDLTVAEALARRRPVIVSNTGSYGVEARMARSRMTEFPLGNVTELTGVLRNFWALPIEHAAEQHRPETHAMAWLEYMV